MKRPQRVVRTPWLSKRKLERAVAEAAAEGVRSALRAESREALALAGAKKSSRRLTVK